MNQTDNSDKVRHAFFDQARYCDALGSPFTARLCRLMAERLQRGSDVADHILNWPGNPTAAADSVPLRIAGCLHALVLAKIDPDLAEVYPSNQSTDETLWDAIVRAFDKHKDFILERMKSAPQTNEVRRSGALLPGFLLIGQRFGLPLVLSEVGASAGLNLQWDRYRYQLGEMSWGDPGTPVSIAPEWIGQPAPRGDVLVAERAGCDLNPVDASNPDHRLRMLSYIWADQTDRLVRTRNALDLAARHQMHIEKSDAIAWLKHRLAQTHSGKTHVIFHTIAWQYFPKALQEEGEKLIAEAGAKARSEAPLARLQLETDGGTDGAGLSLQVWPSGEKQSIGRADFHGRWVEWKGWQ